MEYSGIRAQYRAHKSAINKAVSSVLDSGNFILGPQVERLERDLAEYVGVKYCIGVSNGTDALRLVLMAEGIGPGDAVLTTAFSFFATAECIAQVGAQPIFCDINPDTFNLDPYLLGQVIRRTEREGNMRPRALIAVDLFGQCADYDYLEDICESQGLILIEDAAQSMGAGYKNRKAGSFGKYATTSFFPAKPLGCYGDGGAVFCHDIKIAEQVRSLRVHGQGKDKYDNVQIGMNARLDEIQAAVLNCKLPLLDREVRARQRVADIYTDQLEGVVKVPRIKSDLTSSWAQYTITLKSTEERDQLMRGLKVQGIPCGVYYPRPMHISRAFRLNPFHAMPNAEDMALRVLSLPIHPYLTDEEIERVIVEVKRLTGNPGRAEIKKEFQKERPVVSAAGPDRKRTVRRKAGAVRPEEERSPGEVDPLSEEDLQIKVDVDYIAQLIVEEQQKQERDRETT